MLVCVAVKEKIVGGFCLRRQAKGMTYIWKSLRFGMGVGLASRNGHCVYFHSAQKHCARPRLCGKNNVKNEQRIPENQPLSQEGN